jgi:phosphoserine aminotransferase
MEHYQNLGGLDVLARNVVRRKDLVYAEIDNSEFYEMTVNKAHRSAMSIALKIVLRGEERKDLVKRFVDEAASQGLIQLFGHPVRGGLRVTLYHGVTDEAVDALVKFMRAFRQEHAGK